MELIWRKCATCNGKRVVENDNPIGVGVCGGCYGNGEVLVLDTVALTLILHAVTHFIQWNGDGDGPEYRTLHHALKERLEDERRAFERIGALDKFGRVCDPYELIDAEAKRKFGNELGMRVMRRLHDAATR